MEHVVFFPAADGSPAFRRVPTLDEAVRLVEHLRNVEGLSTVSVAALTEVPLSFRAYYRVEVPTELVPAQPLGAAEPVGLAPVPEPALEEPAGAPVEDVPADDSELVASNGHAPVSPASLGFFA
ncbi:hypothetical protein BH24ACT10_BH24ACT10_02330 [soil metagenome]